MFVWRTLQQPDPPGDNNAVLTGESTFASWLALLIAPVTILILFWSSLTGTDTLGFRDVGHFYLPLYEYIAQRTSHEWLPLWNPLDQTGMPLLGDSTTAVLYPIRYVLFSLPITTNIAMAWYIALHLVLCSFTARFAAIREGVDAVRASIAGVIYPLSGGVLFLYTNPPFLVGAAWLPLALTALIGRKKTGTLSRVSLAAIAMAMMVLGGDPQMALHTMLIAFCALLFGGIRMPGKEWGKHFRVQAVTLLAAPLLAGLLSAPQLAASISWSSQSDRVAAIGDAENWLSPPRVGTMRHDAYQFSLPPWHVAELLAANSFGRSFPQNARVAAQIPGDGRMWTPSIFCGVLATLALISMSVSIRARRTRWYWIGVAALTLCFGHFGIAWLLQQVGIANGFDSAIGSPYWWLHSFLPGYGSFRYPTKWLPVFSLAVGLAIAEFTSAKQGHWFAKREILLFAASVLILGVVVLMGWLGSPLVSKPDELWGPLNFELARQQILMSLFASLLTVGILGLIFTRRQLSVPVRCVMIILVIAAELGIGHRDLISTVPTRVLDKTVSDHAHKTIPLASLWLRTKESTDWPIQWQESASELRSVNVAASERLSWFGRWHLPQGQAVFNNMVSIQSNDIAMFWRATKQDFSDTRIGYSKRWVRIKDWLGIDGVAHAFAVDHQKDALNVNSLVPRKSALPSVRFSHSWVNQAPRTQKVFNELMIETVSSDLPPTPRVHAEIGQPLSEVKNNDSPNTAISIQDEQIVVKAATAGLLSRTVYQDGHWYAEVRSAASSQTATWQRHEVHPVSFVRQGILLEPGEWQIHFIYRPWWLSASLLVAAVSWLGLLLVVLLCNRICKSSVS